jgi:hypothetical protein
MDVLDEARLGEHEQVVVAADVPPVIAESLATIIRLVELVLLDHRAHGTVQEDDALREQFLQALDSLAPCRFVHRFDRERSSRRTRGVTLGRRGGRGRRAVTAGTQGRTPSAWQMAYVSSARLSV